MPIKTMKYHDMPIRRDKTKQSKIVTTPNIGEDIGTHITADEKCTMVQQLWKTVYHFLLKTKYMLGPLVGSVG